MSAPSTSGRPHALASAAHCQAQSPDPWQLLQKLMRQAQALTNTASPAAAPSQAPGTAKPSPSASLRSKNDAPEQPAELSFEPGSKLRAGRYAVGALVSCSPRAEVWHAQQAATGEQVVIKAIVANTPERRRRALQEVELLNQLQQASPGHPRSPGAAKPVRLLDWFVAEGGPHGTHVCLVMEPLHQTAAWVLHYLGKRGRMGLPQEAVQHLARQLLGGLDDLHSHGIVHRDIKPTNLLLAQPFLKRVDAGDSHPSPSSELVKASQQHQRVRTMSLQDISQATWRLIDLGNAARLGRPWFGLGQLQAREPPAYDTPAYAPPEAVLQLPATSAFDMWSAGCVLYEAATGSPLFEIEEGDEWSAEEHHLWMIKELTGQPSLKLLDRSHVAHQYYDERGLLHLERGSLLQPRRMYQTLRQVAGMPRVQAKSFAEFLEPMLAYDPDKRPSAAQQLQHPWLAIQEEDAK